ncbi:hypothetical protein CDD83_6033 [Cordyceps sp. RAO-2017]|nr:hypothetical protein CDD83_6033 [Cordyceps sp. RAO-2017]
MFPARTISAVCLLALAHLRHARALTISNVAVIDVNTGEVQPPQNVIIEGNKIARMEQAGGEAAAGAADTIDGTGKFVMPGLCDMHVHAYFSNDPERFKVTDNFTFPLMIANGVTCVRDLGSNLEAIKSGRDRIAAHQLDGPPRIFLTGPMLDGPNSTFQTALQLNTPDEARQAVRSLKDQGVDYIKVHLKPSREVFDAIAEEAKAARMSFGGHVPDSITAQDAVDAGMNFIEHMSRTEANDSKLIESVVEKKVWQCPTLKLNPAQERLDLTKMLFEAGALMVAGTDSPAGKNLCPGVSLLDELELMHRAGLSQLQTLQAATRNAADSVGMLSKMGTLETGKMADLVLLDENPLEDIGNVRKIRAVVADGQLYEREKLDEMLSRADKLVQCNRGGKLAARDLISAAPSCCSAH